jgi:hypothetical protein
MTHNRKKSMPPVEFETTISAGERPQAAHLLKGLKVTYARQHHGKKKYMSGHPR